MPVDPICRNEVSETTEFKTTFRGENYYFCSPMCKTKFEELDKSFIWAKRFLKEKERVAFAKLKKEIIDQGVCTLCGACIASCDVLKIEAGKPTLVGNCLSCGLCYNQCPRTITTQFGLIGEVREAYTAKTKLKEVKGQDGGAVTSLLVYALDEGLLDCAIVTGTSKEAPWKSIPIVATTKEEVIASAGSKYSHSMTTETLIHAIRTGHRSIGYVGPACNVEALYKMRTSRYGLLHMFRWTNILRLGLFCMDSYEEKGLGMFIRKKKIKPDEIEGMRIHKGEFKVCTKSGENSFPLEELDSHRSSSCMFCMDLTAEKSDISFGSVGSKDGHTTVLARSQLGEEIVQDAADTGYLELAPLGAEAMDRVLSLAKVKKVQLYTIKRRALWALGRQFY